MNIDRGTFLILVSTLAAGGAGGYVVAEKRVFPSLDRWVGRPPEPVATPEPKPVIDAGPTTPPPPPPPPVPAGPVCDDSVGTPGDCPPPGYPTIEGGCGSFAATRCAEYKQGLKPRVAQLAVECLAKLTPHERCDHSRVTLCGHLALMNACPDPDPAGDAGPSPVATACQGIRDACGASPVSPSSVECRQLLSGMSEAGRDRTKACMKGHCFDRGLVGCEALANVPK